MKGWTWGLAGLVAGGAIVAGLWTRTADRARIRADSANARLERQVQAASDRATSAEQLLAGAGQTIADLEQRLRAPRPRLPAPPPPGSPNELPQLRTAVLARDERIDELEHERLETADQLAGVRRDLKVARDSIGALRAGMDSIPEKPCPTPLEPPRLASGMSFAIGVLGISAGTSAALASVVELSVPISERGRLAIAGGPGLNQLGHGVIAVSGRVTFRVF